MTVEDIIEAIRSRDDVYEVHLMDGQSYVRMEFEESKNSGGFLKYTNLGLEEGRKREVKLCVFSKDFLETPTEATLCMEDDYGTVVGHDVPPMMPRSRIKKDGVWVSDEFVVYPNIFPRSELSFVVHPHPLNFLGPETGA